MKRQTAVRTILLIVLFAGPLARHAAAQERRDVGSGAAEFSAGTLIFADDGGVSEGFAGGAGRFYVSPRISIGPEISYISGGNHSHLMLTGNVTFDLLPGGSTSRVTPFAVVGGGLFRTTESFPNNETFSHNEGAFTAGGGVRALVGDRLILGAEARVGWETHVRVSGLVGVRLGR